MTDTEKKQTAAAFREYVLEYQENVLFDPNDLENYNCFTGCIAHVGRRLAGKVAIYINNKDVDIYIILWELYTGLSYRYKHRPSIQEYSSLLLLLDDVVFNTMCNSYTVIDKYYVYCEVLNKSLAEILNIFISEAKIGRQKGASSGRIGDIYLSKAIDGLVEQAAPQTVNNTLILSGDSASEIAKKYHLSKSKND